MGKYHCTVDLLFDWFGISFVTAEFFCFYWQNRLIQTSQTGGPWYSDTSPLSIPWTWYQLVSFVIAKYITYHHGIMMMWYWWLSVCLGYCHDTNSCNFHKKTLMLVEKTKLNSVYLSHPLFLDPSFCLFVCLSIYSSVWLSVCRSADLSVSLFVFLFGFFGWQDCVFVCLSVRPFICPSVYGPVSLFCSSLPLVRQRGTNEVWPLSNRFCIIFFNKMTCVI